MQYRFRHASQCRDLTFFVFLLSASRPCGILFPGDHMKLYYDKNSKNPTYFGQQGYRNGKKTTTRNVINFGKHSELLKITDDPEAYVREEIRKWNEEHRVGIEEIPFHVDFNERVPSSGSSVSTLTPLNIGYLFLQYIMASLNLKEFCSKELKNPQEKLDCFTILRFLTYGVILGPLSGSSFYEAPDLDSRDIQRFLEILGEKGDEFLAWLFDRSSSVIKRIPSIINVCGPGPEMTLFLDGRGIPLTISLDPGNILSLMEKTREVFSTGRFICCAEAGSGSISRFYSLGGRELIVPLSFREMSKSLQKAVLTDSDYRLLSSNAPVSVEDLKNHEDSLSLYNDIAFKVVWSKKGINPGVEKVSLHRIIVTFSRKEMENKRARRFQQADERFSSETSEEEKFDGYRVIATSLNDPLGEVLKAAAQRDETQSILQAMKSPLPSNRGESLICFLALLVVRLLQASLEDRKKPVTAADLLATLRNMFLINIHDLEYMALYSGSSTLTALTDLSLLPLDRLHYRPKDLNGILRKLLK